MSYYPQSRLRRNRKAEWSRSLVAENTLSVNDLVLSLFVIDGVGIKQPIDSMPGVFRYSIDELIKVVKEAKDFGIPMVALFPYIDPSLKDMIGTEALNTNSVIYRAIKRIKDEVDGIGVCADVALDPYTSHGHDGIINDNGYVLNDQSVDILTKQGLLLSQAGCDIVAPSDMMDGRIKKLRNAFESEGHHNTQLLAYSAKYASVFYGPFRDAVGSRALLGIKDKKSYQMDIANSNEALREVAHDIEEGADMVMIKPGLPYLDVIKSVRDNFNIPLFAYQVSGEYSMIKFAASHGVIDEDRAFIETMIAFKRAGCCGVFTYAAIQIAKILNKLV